MRAIPTATAASAATTAPVATRLRCLIELAAIVRRFAPARLRGGLWAGTIFMTIAATDGCRHRLRCRALIGCCMRRKCYLRAGSVTVTLRCANALRRMR